MIGFIIQTGSNKQHYLLLLPHPFGKHASQLTSDTFVVNNIELLDFMTNERLNAFILKQFKSEYNRINLAQVLPVTGRH